MKTKISCSAPISRKLDCYAIKKASRRIPFFNIRSDSSKPDYFAASPQAGTTACIKGFNIFIEQAKT
jgi:hypothetical protein